MNNEIEDKLAGIALEDFRPAFAENNIPVAFATDENYQPYLKVVVRSILANTKNGNIDLIVLNNGLDAKSQRDFVASFEA